MSNPPLAAGDGTRLPAPTASPLSTHPPRLNRESPWDDFDSHWYYE